MQVTVGLQRSFDRHPGQHLYGDPFDTQIDSFVGGREKWSSPREGPDTPIVSIGKPEIKVELHEDGAMFDFFVSQADQIPDYISAIAAVVSAWAGTRKLREASLPKGDINRRSGTSVVVGDMEVYISTNLDPTELTELVITVARLQERRRRENDA